MLGADDEMGGKYLEEHQRNMQKWIESGEIKVNTDVTVGWERSVKGFAGMLKGEDFGKAVAEGCGVVSLVWCGGMRSSEAVVFWCFGRGERGH